MSHDLCVILSILKPFLFMLLRTHFRITFLTILSISTSFPVFAQLSGNLTIGTGVLDDYPTINLAILVLNTSGTSGPVTFLISGGTYDEQVTITDAAGHTVTIKPKPGHLVTWQYSAATFSSVILSMPGS